MGWENFPPQPGTDIQAYDWLIQIWKACRERLWVLGEEYFPRLNHIWESGTVASIEPVGDGTSVLSDPTKNWVPELGYCSGDRWTNYVCPSIPYIPANYDVVIDLDINDPRKCLRGRIVGNTLSTLTVSGLEDYVTAGLIPSVDELAGQRYHIIKADGLWWCGVKHGRWLDWPNDQELDKGAVAIATTTTLSIADPAKHWPTNQWAGKDLLVYAGEKLQRRSITSNSGDTLTFDAMPVAPEGAYIIVSPGGVGIPGRKPPAPFRWYGGAEDAFWSHHPDDSLGSVNLPATTVVFSVGAIGSCHDMGFPALDRDVWSEREEECSEADKCYSPNLYKTLRGIQAWLEGICDRFIQAKDYDGAAAIPSFAVATFFAAADINAGTGTLAGPDEDGNTFFAVLPIYSGAEIYWTVLKENGDIESTGSGTAADGVVIVGTDTTLVGRTVIYSAGWTRYHPREFSYLYERSAFIPDIGDSGPVDPPAVVDFPGRGEFGVGSWIKRPASTEYKWYGGLGLSRDDGGAFQSGDCARYARDNWHDPGTGMVATTNALPADLPYWDRFFAGRHTKPPYGTLQKQIRGGRVGVSTSGTNDSLTDTSKHWWDPHWYAGGELRVESGVATGGSASTLEIEPEKMDPDNPAHAFWIPERFEGFEGPYVEFILEIDQTVGEQTVTFKLPITGVDGRTLQFASLPGLSVAAGDVYRIREPKYNLNRYKGMTLKLTDPATGSTHEVTITHSDDQTLFFATQGFAIGAGWTYQILEQETGGVWQWDGSQWIKPSGDDPRGQPWHANTTENLTHKTKRFGKILKSDYMATHIFDELYRAINALRWTKNSVQWSPQYPSIDPVANPELVKNNYNGWFPPHTFNWELDNWPDQENWHWNRVTTGYDAFIGSQRLEGTPKIYGWDSKCHFSWSGLFYEINGMEEMIFQPVVSGIPTLLACAKEVLALATKTSQNIGAYNIEEHVFNDWGYGLTEDRYRLIKSAEAAALPEVYWDYLTVQPDEYGTEDYFQRYAPYTDVPIPPHPHRAIERVAAPYPPADDLTNFRQEGFVITDAICVFKRDVTGGLSYVD